MADFIFQNGEAINLGVHGEHDYVLAGSEPVTDQGTEGYVYESGTPLGGGLGWWTEWANGQFTGSSQQPDPGKTKPVIKWVKQIPTDTSSFGYNIESNFNAGFDGPGVFNNNEPYSEYNRAHTLEHGDLLYGVSSTGNRDYSGHIVRGGNWYTPQYNRFESRKHQDGTLRWTTTQSDIETALGYSSGTIYLNTACEAAWYDGSLIAVVKHDGAGSVVVSMNPTDGSVEWGIKMDTSFGTTSQTDGTLAINEEDGEVYWSEWDRWSASAVDLDNQTIKWDNTSDFGHDLRAGSSYDPNTGLTFTAHTGSSAVVYALNISDGSIAWQYSLPSSVNLPSQPTVINGNVFMACKNNLVALDAATGTHQWTDSNFSGIGEGGPVRGKTSDVIYKPGNNGQIYAYDPSNGTRHWVYNTDQSYVGNLSVHGGNLYLGSLGGHLYKFGTVGGDRGWWHAWYDKARTGKTNNAGVGTSKPSQRYQQGESSGSNTGPESPPTTGLGGMTFYPNSKSDKFHATNLEATVDAWSSSNTTGNPATPPVVYQDRVFCLESDQITAFKRATGSLIWSQNSNFVAEPESDLLYHNGSIIHVARNSEVVSIDAVSGSVNWTNSAGSDFTSSDRQVGAPCIGNGNLYWTDPGEQVAVGFDISAQSRLWTHSLAGTPNGGCVYDSANSTVYCCGGGVLYALDPTDGSEKWTYNMPGTTNDGSQPTLANGHVYVTTNSTDAVVAVNTSDGSESWRDTTPALSAQGGMAIDTDNIGYLQSETGVIHGYDTSDGTHLWSFNTGEDDSSYDVRRGVTILGGKLYLTTNNSGYIICLE